YSLGVKQTRGNTQQGGFFMIENKFSPFKFLPLNLQFFAEGGESGDQAPVNEPGGQEQTEQTVTDTEQKSEEKLFRQEDVNNIVAREAKKAQEKLLKELGIDDFENAKDGLAKFREWQESQKTEQEKLQETLQKFQADNETLASENANLKAQLAAMKQGVKADSVEDVIALAERLVNEETTIDDAIKQVIEKYPQFAQSEEEQKPNFTTGQHQTSGDSSNDPFAIKLAKYK